MTNGERHQLEDEINALVEQRAEHRIRQEWQKADQLKRLLKRPPYGVEIIDLADHKSRWKVLEVSSVEEQVEYDLDWSELLLDDGDHCHAAAAVVDDNHGNKNQQHSGEDTNASSLPGDKLPIIILTIDSPEYRIRYRDTVQFMEVWQKRSAVQLSPIPVEMLRRSDHPDIPVRKLIYEGWRRKLLPYLLSEEFNHNEICKNLGFLLIGEDDFRPNMHFTPTEILTSCRDAFAANPNLQLLSLGHAWKLIAKKQNHEYSKQNGVWLLDFLNNHAKQDGVHGATLLAVKYPQGISAVYKALDDAASQKKQTHLDLFLFFSKFHNLELALSDPPLAGWGEVDTTLTRPGSGFRRRGGGRLEYHPPDSWHSTSQKVRWVQRKLLERKETKA